MPSARFCWPMTPIRSTAGRPGAALARATLHGIWPAQGPRPTGTTSTACAPLLGDDTLDPAYRALMLAQPGQSEIAGALYEAGTTPDPMAIWTASETLKTALATHVQDLLPGIYTATQVDAPYRPDAEQSGKRALGGAVLSLLSRLDDGTQARAQYGAADNMTLQLSALSCLLSVGAGAAELLAFYDQWQHDRLVIDKWFSLQILQADPAAAVGITKALTLHPDFNWKNPNRFRATLGALSMNHAGFHGDRRLRLQPAWQTG